LVLEMRGVLYDATLWRREVVKLLGRLGVAASFPDFFSRWDCDYLPDVQRGFRQFDEAFQAFLLANGLTWAQIDEVEAASRLRRLEVAEGDRPLPGVASTVRRLCEQGFSLAVLADSPLPATRLEAQLQKLGLASYFRRVIASQDLEVTKPDPQCYRAAAAAMGLPAEALAFVGCDKQSLAGARAYGLRTIGVNLVEPVPADACLAHFGELLEVVRRWSAPEGAL
jgi:HAD superfamily hydrolase (TIGR01509 family)